MDRHQSWDGTGAPKLSGLPAIELLRDLQRGSPFVIVAAPSDASDEPVTAAPGTGRREAERRMERMIESAMAGIWFSAPAGKTSFMNERMAQILGLTLEEAADAKVTDFVDASERDDVAKRLAERMSGVSASYEHRFLRKDRSIGWGLFESSPLFDAEGGFEGVLTVMTDVTAHRASQDAVLGLEDQLRQSQKMEAVGRLAGGVAHDFNNLLSVVLGYSELIIGDLKAGDPLRADVEEIRRAGKRAADLTHQLLAFSRQQAIETTVLVLNDIVVGMDKMLQRILGEDVALECVLDASLGSVRGDPGSLEQIVMNLAINARDAMPVGGKLTIQTSNVTLDEVYVKSHFGAAPGPYVMLAVTDTGTGIDSATMARMFEPFFTTKDKGKGTGLGLSTVFGIVQQCGGSIWVYSDPGRGATFKVYLPRIDALGAELPKLREPTPVPGGETVLIVEDDEQVRNVAMGILRRRGYTVLEASTAPAAILHCETHDGTIHLLLSDVVMPVISGPALAAQLTVLRPAMRVLFMSGYTDDAAVRHGVIDATFAYLQKPLTVDTLTKKVRSVLDSTT